MRPRRFHLLLGLALQSTLLACSSSVDKDGFATDPVCSRSGEKAGVEALRAQLGMDWVLIGGDESGVPCATATDKAACNAKVETAKAAGAALGFGSGNGPGMQFLMSKGDDVKRPASSEELRAALAPIDSSAKAYYLFKNSRYLPDCDAFIKKTSDGYELIGTITTSDCDPVVTEEHRVQITKDGVLTVLEKVEQSSKDGVCIGRRPEGLHDAERARVNVLADWFARAAELEAASVHAFEILREELAYHGAPKRLLRACERARRDEIRHTTMMTKLARRFGAEPKAPVVERRPIRSLRAIAIENATEGCVRETYGAIEAAVSAARATDRVVARTMKVVARDEARHAELSWDVLSWIRSRLSPGDRAAVVEAMRAETASLAADLARGNAPVLERIAGLPSPAQAEAALAALHERFWSAAA